MPDPNYATLKFFMGHLDRYVIDLIASMDQAQTNGAFKNTKDGIYQSDVCLQLEYCVWSNITRSTARRRRFESGAYEFPVQSRSATSITHDSVTDAVDFRRLSRRSWTNTMRFLSRRKKMGSSKVELCKTKKLVLRLRRTRHSRTGLNATERQTLLF